MRRILLFAAKQKRCLPNISQMRNLSVEDNKSWSYKAHFENNLPGEVSGRSFEENVFEMYKNPATDLVNIGQILTVIERTGVRRSDPRLQQMMTKLSRHHKKHGEENTTIENLNLDLQTFSKMVEADRVLLAQTCQNKMIIPDWQPFCQIIKDIFKKCKSNTKGTVASYIPQLAKYSNDLWGLSVCTVDGQRLSLGNVDTAFTLQSCSKPFTYGVCLQQLGHEHVHQYIGYEPSGRNFNEICLDRKNKPHNPMLNGGAIMSCALILNKIDPRSSLADKYDFLFNNLHKLGGEIECAGVLGATADRNFSMGYFMKEQNCFPKGADLHETLDLYFQSCSMEINTETLAVMGATLANGGVCPTTGDKVLDSSNVRDVLSLMYSCGMYNYSGEFSFQVGLPAKSGVSGAIFLVVPNVMCVALWSPPLDSLGNSVRGIQFCRKQGLHVVTLLFAAVAGDTAALQRLHLQGLDMGATDYDGRTALHLAAAEGHLDCVKFLMDICDVTPDPVDRWGHTPIQEAERENHMAVVEFLKTVSSSEQT